MAAEVGENAIDIALKVARALTAVGAEYFLGGSLASSLQGEPRATNDIDFVIALSLGKVGELAAALGRDFEVDTDTLRDAILRASCANAFYLPVVTKIDFFGRGYEPFDESEFSRRRATSVTAGGDSLVVKAPEDTVLRKLLWFREGGKVSEKQWRDVVSVLQISGDRMDQTYLSGLLISSRVLTSACGFSSGRCSRIDRKHSSRISVVHRARTTPAWATRTSRSRNGAGCRTQAS